MINTLYLIGYGSGIAAAREGCAEGPSALQHSPYLATLTDQGIHLQWEGLLIPPEGNYSKLDKVAQLTQSLSQQVYQLALNEKFFTVLGGDHSCAIGTWSGAFAALEKKGPLGLIWIDAHMDAHTPETTPSGNIHGMPIACLLGYGDEKLTHNQPKIDPEHLCLIGVRSFEPGEAALLERLKVRVIMMDEVKERGLNAVMREAIHIASDKTAGFGVSIDIDGIDPEDAPGTGMREPDGIRADDLCMALQLMVQQPKLMGIEIVEFDVSKDLLNMTERLIPQLILSIIHEKITV